MIQKRNRALIIALACALLFTGFACAPTKGNGKPRLLRLNLDKNKTYTLKMNTVQNMTNAADGQKFTQNVDMALNFKVLDKSADGIYMIDVSYGNIKMKIDLGGGNSIEMDPANPTTPPAKIFAALINKGFQMKMDSMGKVHSMKGFEEVLENAIRASGLQGEQLQLQLTNMKKQFGSEAFQKNLGQMMSVFPEKAVAIGDSWNNNNVYDPISINSKYTVKDIQGDVIIVLIDSQITPVTAKKGATVQMKLNGSQKSETHISLKSGWTLKSNATQKLVGESETPQGPVKLNIDSQITMNGE